jgi:hypothetical protein
MLGLQLIFTLPKTIYVKKIWEILGSFHKKEAITNLLKMHFLPTPKNLFLSSIRHSPAFRNSSYNQAHTSKTRAVLLTCKQTSN